MIEKTRSFKFISADVLKLIAIVTMLIDHIGASFIANMINNGLMFGVEYSIIRDAYNICRLIGRVAFPIFCFLLIEGLLHTSNPKKYILNMLIFSILSEIPFDLAFNNSILEFNSQNVFLTLSIGLIATWLIDMCVKCNRFNFVIKVLIEITISGCAIALAIFAKTDYSYIGIMLILTLYIFKFNRIAQCLLGIVVFLSLTSNYLDYASSNSYYLYLWLAQAVGLILAIFYNGTRKMKVNKYIFYCFYPVHLLILFICWELVKRLY